MEYRGDKALGPNRYSSQFFKDAWEVVGKDITGGCWNFVELV